MIPKWSQNDSKMIPKWSQNDFLKIPKFVYCSPGDRAQKVIPGGVKTNESFWKSQNNIKKTILRFPSFLLTIALVIERKKLSPEARKQTRASESLKITSKNNFTFPIMYVYYSPGDLYSPFGDFWDPLETLRSSLGRQVALEAELWGHTTFWTKTSKLAEAFVKKWKGGPQNSSASTIFFEKA